MQNRAGMQAKQATDNKPLTTGSLRLGGSNNHQHRNRHSGNRHPEINSADPPLRLLGMDVHGPPFAKWHSDRKKPGAPNPKPWTKRSLWGRTRVRATADDKQFPPWLFFDRGQRYDRQHAMRLVFAKSVKGLRTNSQVLQDPSSLQNCHKIISRRPCRRGLSEAPRCYLFPPRRKRSQINCTLRSN